MPEITEEELQRLKDAEKKGNDFEKTNKRLLGENVDAKERAKAAEAKLLADEEAKLLADGETEKLLDKEKLRSAELEDKLSKRTKTASRERLRTEVSKFAKDAHDIDMVLKVTEHKDLLKIDEEALTVEGVEEYVTKVRETHSYLFGKKRMPNDADRKPGNKNDEDLDDDKTEEERFRTELKNVNTRAEQAAVYKKYNKPVDSFMRR